MGRLIVVVELNRTPGPNISGMHVRNDQVEPVVLIPAH